ncbi:hypothetical protein GTP55_17995 [Duganella sp. FT109W]|uniref:DUF1329 domain-containing protein n=1 Tax=Duganella margarita TaxID=2692170 RepID=A0ABW9WJF9_9BURK|nr:hypothetical protein [Duganella margarita]MYN41259.1 hypothetical protein [Duganella margarita]
MNYLVRKYWKLAIVTGALAGTSAFGQAACNSPKNWLETPGTDTKVFIGYKQEQKPGFGALNVGTSPVDYPYPDPLPREMLDTEGAGKLSKDETSDVSYYEPDGKGNWRVCRVEQWWSAGVGQKSLRDELKPVTARYVASNPVLKKLGPESVALFATLYFYDSKGRIIRLEQGEFQKNKEKASIKICREYDKEDNLTLLLNPKNSQRCQANPPDVRDEWIRYRYGKHDGKLVQLLEEWNRGSASGKWGKDFELFRTGTGPDAVFGAAKARIGKGVTVIYGTNAGKLDNNAANTVLDSFGKVGAAAYWFIKPPIPLDVLDKPDLLYQYERRRQTYIDGPRVRLLELFKPNEHRSRHRYYLVGTYVMRHEQFDSNGRVTRVVTLDDWRQPRPGPKPDINDKLLTDDGLSIKTHQIYHRVYDFDSQGKPRLVAVSWDRATRNPLKKTSALSADVVYGTPSGKELWKSEEEFCKHFDFSPEAAQVFPDVANGEEPEQI